MKLFAAPHSSCHVLGMYPSEQPTSLQWNVAVVITVQDTVLSSREPVCVDSQASSLVLRSASQYMPHIGVCHRIQVVHSLFSMPAKVVHSNPTYHRLKGFPNPS